MPETPPVAGIAPNPHDAARTDRSVSVLDLAGAIGCLDGDQALLRELLGVFRDEAAGQLDRIRQALADLDPRSLGIAAHGLKGSMSHFSRPPALEPLVKLEQLGRSGTLDGADRYVDLCVNNLAVLLAEITDELNHGAEG